MSDFVSLGGRRIEYELKPAPAGAPTLVFLHQGLGSLALWRDLPAVLAARTRCGALAYSRLGHGWSDPEPGPRTTDFLVNEGRDALPALLDALRVRDIILIGHSDGGTIALTYLAAGHKARRAIVAAPHVFDEEITWRAIAAQQALWPGDLRPRLARYHRDPDETFRAWAEFWLAPAFRGWSILPLLPAIACPILAVQGEDDPYGSMRQIEAVSAHAGGSVRLERLPSCGHDPFRDRRDRMLDLAVEFIAQTRA